MTKKPRTPRTAAFKKKIALKALREDKTLSQLATEHGVHPLLIGRWKKELIAGAKSLFEGKKVMDRRSAYKTVDNGPMQASEHPAFQLLLTT